MVPRIVCLYEKILSPIYSVCPQSGTGILHCAPCSVFFFLDYQTANQIFLKFRHNITKEKCYESIFLAFTELLCLWEGISRNDSWDLLAAATSFFI